MSETMWIWQAKKGACSVCEALNGRIFTTNELPEKPHPNCRCTIKSISPAEDDRPAPVLIYGELGGFEATATEEFEGRQRISITFKNMGLHVAGVSVRTNAGNQSTGHMLPSQSVTLEFSRFDYEPMHWLLFMRVEAEDNTLIWYRIDG